MFIFPTALYGGAAAPPPPAGTWNPADKHANIVLSGGNLIAANSSGAVVDSNVRSTNTHNSGKWYFECTWTLNQGGHGIANSTASIGGSGMYIGHDGNSTGYYGYSDSYFLNGLVGSLLGVTANNGDVIATAFDADLQHLWFKNLTQATNWNALFGVGDPATDTFPIVILPAAGPYYIMADAFQNAASQVTLNVGGSAFSGTPPSGFSAWG